MSNEPQPAVSVAPDSGVVPSEPAQAAAAAPGAGRALRLWPGLVIVLVQWALLLVPGWVVPGTMVHFLTMMWGPVVGTLAVVLWWLAASRAAKKDKWLVLAVVVASAVATILLCDRQTVPMMLLLRGLPIVMTLWVAWLAFTARLSWPVRRAGLLTLIVLGFGYFTLIRVDGVDGSINAETRWRWAPTAEQVFLASRARTVAGSGASRAADDGEDDETESALALQPGDWAEFRGPNRDSRLHGVTIADDWERLPPKLVWKQRLGPGWGSFAVVGDRLFTQEQRGDDEAVVCYRATDGQELWSHLDATRFWELIGGAGPRATPTFHEGRLYTVGANGRLNCLDAATGKLIWGQDMIRMVTGLDRILRPEVKVPEWGYSSSPLIVGDTVLVLPARPDGKAMLAYDRRTGQQQWSAGPGTHSYSSPQLATFDGVPQVLSVTDAGLTSLDPDSGDILWHYDWNTGGMHRLLQPFVDGDSVVISTYFGVGTRRIRVSHADGEWSTAIDWPKFPPQSASNDLKSYFNDFVEQGGYAYGFDANIFCCLDLATGKRAWKGGRYGYGQVLLLVDQKLLLVLSETGEAVLLRADPQRHVELGRIQAIEGKTWNHPVIARGRLYVRNAEEMACYDVTPPQSVAGR